MKMCQGEDGAPEWNKDEDSTMQITERFVPKPSIYKENGAPGLP
jgi:hypothetical protein